MFLSVRQLQCEYPFVNKYRGSIPFVWIYHVMTFPMKKASRGVLRKEIQSDSEVRTEITQRRMEVFRALGMIQDEVVER